MNKGYMVVSCMEGLCESIKNTCKKHGLQVYFNGGRTIKSLLAASNNSDTIIQKSEAMSWVSQAKEVSPSSSSSTNESGNHQYWNNDWQRKGDS